MHRKPSNAGRNILAGIIFMAVTALVASAAMLLTGQPAHASVRPYWNGRSPAVWISPVDPMCLGEFSGRHGWVKADSHHFRAVCRAGSWDIL